MLDNDIPLACKLSPEPLDEPVVQLNCQDRTCARSKQPREVALAGADLEDPVLRRDRGGFDDPGEVMRVLQEVLAQGFFGVDVIVHRYLRCCNRKRVHSERSTFTTETLRHGEKKEREGFLPVLRASVVQFDCTMLLYQLAARPASAGRACPAESRPGY